jgi:hypothetical protein
MFPRFSTTSIMTATLLVLSLLTSAAAVPSSNLALGPRVRHPSSNSTNWSGFAVTAGSGAVSDAKGSWIVPTIQGTCTSTNQYSSFWVGIDGFNSGTVEQTGTDSDCQNGAPTYYAWYEFYPHPSFLISGLTIHPGDHISAEVSFANRRFTTTITDVTTGLSFSTSARVSGAQRSSAEWIAEAPSSSGGILPLADFGTVSYGTDNTGVASTCFATINGATGAIGSFSSSSIQSITMVTNSGATKAQPSALSSDGTSFSVRWVSSGP